MSLAGSDHITIAPTLLRALHDITDKSFESIFDDRDLLSGEVPAKLSLIDDEETFRISFTKNDQGLQEIKQIKAINIFANMQTKLEEIVASYLE